MKKQYYKVHKKRSSQMKKIKNDLLNCSKRLYKMQQQAVEDDDLMIVNTVISVASQLYSVCLVGVDIGLLVWLTALTLKVV